MCIELKDILFLIFGTVIGLIVGIAIYWLPLGQFKNEWLAIWNLIRKKYKEGDELTIRAGIDLKPLNPNLQILTTTDNFKVKIWGDEGVNWHHTHLGWKRARVLHVFESSSKQGIQNVYKVCHLDIDN